MLHKENSERLRKLLDDYSLTMQHAIRANAVAELEKMRLEDGNGIMPPLTIREFFDFKVDSDPDFLNWMFPFCAVELNETTMSYIHQKLLHDFRNELPADVDVPADAVQTVE